MVQERDLTGKFSACNGKIRHVFIPRDEETKKSKYEQISH